MSIDRLPMHYSFQNIPTAYDEEALTALELCGRLGRKVNEVIAAVNGWQVPNIIHVYPTGDKSGGLDRAAIQGKLDAGYAVQLAPGEYYLDGPILMKAGYMLRGESQLRTVMNCKAGFIDHVCSVSVDHIEVRDLCVKGPGEGVGIDISRKLSGVETGGRYAHFMNVYLSGYNTGVLMAGCWCTNFTHCRIEAEEICVEQRGGCNHIKYDHCMFLGPVDQKTTTAVKISAEGGAENYGIRFDHCDFERHKYAIHAYYCVALNVTAMYVEGTDTVFQLDSCPGFQLSGGYISYPRIVLQGGRTNALPLYEKSGGAIRDIFVKVNSDEKWPLMSTPDVYPVITENVTVANDGSGTCYANAQQYSSIFNGVSTSEKIHIRALMDGDYNALHYLPVTAAKNGCQYKIIRGNLIVHKKLVQPTATTYRVSHITIPNLTMLFNIPAGTYEAGHVFTSHFTDYVGSDYSKLIVDDLPAVNAWCESGNISTDSMLELYVEIAMGNFKL